MGMTVQQMPWTYLEVVSLFPASVARDTPGVNSAHLDRNADGLGCGAGDS